MKRIIERMNESSPYGTATWRYWQKIFNALPARDLPDRPAVPVRVRVVFAEDGEQWLNGEATRLDPGAAIYVRIRDRRVMTLGVWLHPDDVWWEAKLGF